LIENEIKNPLKWSVHQRDAFENTAFEQWFEIPK
jgi:hypothetical protein